MRLLVINRGFRKRVALQFNVYLAEPDPKGGEFFLECLLSFSIHSIPPKNDREWPRAGGGAGIRIGVCSSVLSILSVLSVLSLLSVLLAPTLVTNEGFQFSTRCPT